MADIHGGRVLAGEDSEEDEEDEEEMSFQFNGFSSKSSPAAPRFAVPTVVAPPAGAEGEEDEESDEEDDENEKVQLKAKEKTAEVDGEDVEANEDEEEDNDVQEKEEESKTTETKQQKEKTLDTSDELPQLWQVDESVNGIDVMSNAFVDTVQPSLDATIHRITELKESQQRLLKMLVEQNTGLKSNKQLEDAAVVLEKLPFYAKKLQGIKLAMQEISTSAEKMKRRAESLRIDAQSYAIKKENKRDAQSQWNKLYAAKSAPGPGASSGQS